MTDTTEYVSVPKGVVEAAQAIIDNMTSTYTARNGRNVGIQGDDGEKCFIIHSGYTSALEYYLSTISPSPTPPTDGVKE